MFGHLALAVVLLGPIGCTSARLVSWDPNERRGVVRHPGDESTDQLDRAGAEAVCEEIAKACGSPFAEVSYFRPSGFLSGEPPPPPPHGSTQNVAFRCVNPDPNGMRAEIVPCVDALSPWVYSR